MRKILVSKTYLIIENDGSQRLECIPILRRSELTDKPAKEDNPSYCQMIDFLSDYACRAGWESKQKNRYVSFRYRPGTNPFKKTILYVYRTRDGEMALSFHNDLLPETMPALPTGLPVRVGTPEPRFSGTSRLFASSVEELQHILDAVFPQNSGTSSLVAAE